MSILSSINNRVRSAVQTARSYATPAVDRAISGAQRVVSGARSAQSLYNSGRSTFTAATNVITRGRAAASQAMRDSRQVSTFSGGARPSVLNRVTGPLGLVNNVVNFGRGVGTSFSTVRQAVISGSRSDINEAARSVLSTARSGIGSAQSAFQVWGARQAHQTYNAAVSAFRTAAPNASREAGAAAARSATRDSFMRATAGNTGTTVTRQVAQRSAQEAARAATPAAATVTRAVTGSGARAAERAAALAVTQGSNAAVRAATSSAARAAASTVGRAAARFAPGVNVAMAAIDTANAVRTLADPNSSRGQRWTSVITAAGSIAAATNIPVVSQIGAGVATVSSFVGSFF